MAYFEFNALSVVLGGSFTARVFLPGLDKLRLDDKVHATRYPVVWLLHTDGETSLQFMRTPIENLAEKYGFIAIAPDMHHAMGTNMKFGPNYEKFLVKEIQGIFRNVLPISAEPKNQFIGGVGTGGWAALKIAAKYPELYSKGFSLNGILDMESLIRRTAAGEKTGVPQTPEAFEAVFGSLKEFRGGRDDLFAVVLGAGDGSLYLSAERDFPYFGDSEAFAAVAGQRALFVPLLPGQDFESFQSSFRFVTAWLFDGREV